MSFSNWLAAAVAALLPLVAAAGQTQVDPADAQAAIPAYRYELSFQHYRAATDETETPDAVWVGANQALLKQDGQDSHGAQKAQADHSAAPAQKTPDPHAAHHAHHSEGH